MSNTYTRQIVTIKDNPGKNLKDRLITGPSRKNHVKIFEKTGDAKLNLLEESHNLIVYHGRSWLMQRAFGLNLGATGSTPWAHNTDASVTDIYHGNWSNMYINWFAIGEGGCLEENLLEPKSVISPEYQLITHSPITESPSEITSGNLRYTHPSPISATRDYHTFDSYYPQFQVDPDIVPDDGEGSEDSDYLKMQTADSTSEILYSGVKTDAYLRAVVRTTLETDECNGPKYYDVDSTGEEYRYISEAGLFASPSYDPDNACFSQSIYDPLQLFAKVNFSSIRKDSTRSLVFVWYLYF